MLYSRHTDDQCQWLVARIGDGSEQIQELLDSLVEAMQHSVGQSCWDAVDREGLSAIEYVYILRVILTYRHSATTKQLDCIFAAREDAELQWLLSSAETVEMPRILSESPSSDQGANQADAIAKATLDRMSEGKSSGGMFALFSSLPSTVLDDDARQAILIGAQAAEAHANQDTIRTIRQALVHLIRGSSVKVGSRSLHVLIVGRSHILDCAAGGRRCSWKFLRPLDS